MGGRGNKRGVPVLNLFFCPVGGCTLKSERQVKGYSHEGSPGVVTALNYLRILILLRMYCTLSPLLLLFQCICLVFHLSFFGIHLTETEVIAHYGLELFNRSYLRLPGPPTQRSLWSPISSQVPVATDQRNNFRRHLPVDVMVMHYRRPYTSQ